jgi:hypothetical protein
LQEALQEIAAPAGRALNRRPDLRPAEGHARLTAEGPVVVGPRGHALNVASSLHRVFQALGIPSEVRCAPVSELEDRRQIQIRFPADLSESQREDVRLLLGLIRAEVATL